MSIKKKQVCTLILALALLTLTLASCTSSDNGGAADGNAPSQSNQTDADPSAGTENETSEPDIAVEDELTVTLYLPNDNADGFDTVEETVEASPQGIVDALIAHGVLPEGVTVDAFETMSDGVETQEGDVVSYEVGELSITLDLSEEFLSAVTGTGTAGETMVMGSLVNTMLTAYNAQTLTLTCGGEAVETGHAVYDEPMTFFEVS